MQLHELVGQKNFATGEESVQYRWYTKSDKLIGWFKEIPELISPGVGTISFYAKPVPSRAKRQPVVTKLQEYVESEMDKLRKRDGVL